VKFKTERGKFVQVKDASNRQWSFEDIAYQYKKENPDWSCKQCCDKARIIYRELNKLNRKMSRNTSKFFKHNTPFSFYEYEDKHLSFIPELDEI